MNAKLTGTCAVDAMVRRRNEVMQKADEALQADWPARMNPEFVRITRWAIGELEDLTGRMEVGQASALERSRTQRHLAGLHADLAPALGKEQLLTAERTYRAAERLLAGTDDADEAAKLDFDLANILRQIDPNDIVRLDEARERVLRARAHFAAHDPKHVERCDALLQSVDCLAADCPAGDRCPAAI